MREQNADYRRRRVELKGALTSVEKGGKHDKYKTGTTPRLCASNVEDVMFWKNRGEEREASPVTEKGSRVVTDYGWCSRRSRIGSWDSLGGGRQGVRFSSVPYNGLAPLARLDHSWGMKGGRLARSGIVRPWTGGLGIF